MNNPDLLVFLLESARIVTKYFSFDYQEILIFL